MVIVFVRSVLLRVGSTGSSKIMTTCKIKLKSLIMAQIERWRQALDMQVERKRWELALRRRAADG